MMQAGCLVAAGGEYDADERVPIEHLDEAEVGEVAIEASGRSLAGLLDLVNRELEGNATGLTDPLSDLCRKLEVMTVTRREVRAGLRNPNDRFAGL